MAVKFASVGDLLYRLQASGLPNVRPLTHCFFIRVDSDSNDLGPVVVRYEDGPGSTRQQALMDSTGATNLLKAEAQTSGSASTGVALTVNTWYPAALKVVFNSPSLETHLYVNGVFVESISSADATDSSGSMAVGSTGANLPKISVAAWKIWTSTLTDPEILAEAGSLAPVKASPWANYQFASGALTTDSSGNGRTLTSNGTPTFTADPSIGGSTKTLTASLSVAIQAARTLTASIGTAIQDSRTATASVGTVIQLARTATSVLDIALLQAKTLTASVDVGVQISRTVAHDISAAIQISRTATLSADLAISRALTAVASVDSAVQEGKNVTSVVSTAILEVRTAISAIDTAVQTSRTAVTTIGTIVQLNLLNTASIDLALREAKSISASIDMMVQAAFEVSTMLQIAIQQAKTVSASIGLAVSQARTSGFSIDAFVLSTIGVFANLDLAVQISRNLSHSIDLVVQESKTHSFSVDALVIARNSAQCAIDTAIKSSRATVAALNAYVFDPDTILVRAGDEFDVFRSPRDWTVTDTAVDYVATRTARSWKVPQ